MTVDIKGAIGSLREQPWTLWWAQLSTILRIELKKNLFRRQSLATYFLAFAPAGVVFLHAIIDGPRGRCDPGEDTRILAGIFQFYYLRLGIFFGCMATFTWLFRGEISERSLHYYFLVPMRREVLVVGKFLSGVITTTTVFGLAVLSSFAFMYSHFGPAGMAFVFEGPGLRHLYAYLLTTALACFGYGALFLALSLVFRNPIVPGIIALGWETISGVLPSMMQKLTVTYYLKHLCPVPAPSHGFLALFTVVPDPISRWLAVVGVLVLTAAILVFACLRIRTLEISYTTE